MHHYMVDPAEVHGIITYVQLWNRLLTSALTGGVGFHLLNTWLTTMNNLDNFASDNLATEMN